MSINFSRQESHILKGLPHGIMKFRRQVGAANDDGIDISCRADIDGKFALSESFKPSIRQMQLRFLSRPWAPCQCRGRDIVILNEFHPRLRRRSTRGRLRDWQRNRGEQLGRVSHGRRGMRYFLLHRHFFDRGCPGPKTGWGAVLRRQRSLAATASLQPCCDIPKWMRRPPTPESECAAQWKQAMRKTAIPAKTLQEHPTSTGCCSRLRRSQPFVRRY